MTAYIDIRTQERTSIIRIGTMFEETKLPLRTWFMAIYLMISTKKAVASKTLAHQPGVTQKKA